MSLLSIVCLGMCGSVYAQVVPIERIDHYAINSSNLEKSAAWYGEVFGLTPIQKWNGVWLIGKGAIRVGIFQAPLGASAPTELDKSVAFLHVAFSVPSGQLQIVKDRLTYARIPYREEDIGIATSLFINDPDGNELELIHYK